VDVGPARVAAPRARRARLSARRLRGRGGLVSTVLDRLGRPTTQPGPTIQNHKHKRL
jgi:hypothetical protein